MRLCKKRAFLLLREKGDVFYSLYVSNTEIGGSGAKKNMMTDGCWQLLIGRVVLSVILVLKEMECLVFGWMYLSEH